MSKVPNYTKITLMENFQSKMKHKTLCKNYADGGLKNAYILSKVKSNLILLLKFIQIFPLK